MEFMDVEKKDRPVLAATVEKIKKEQNGRKTEKKEAEIT